MPKTEQEIEDEGVEEGSATPTDQATEHAESPAATDEVDVQSLADEALAEARGDEPPAKEEDAKDAAAEDEQDDVGADGEKEAADADDTTAEDEERIPDEEFKALPKGVKGRINTLTRQKREAEEARDELQAQIEQNKPAAEAFQTISTEMGKAGLNGQELSAFLTFGAAFKQGDMQRAHDIIKPFWEQISRARGDDLDDHHRTLVENGDVTEDVARTMQRQAAELDRRQRADAEAATRADQQRQQAEVQDQQTQAAQAVRAATADEQTKLRSEDPLFDQKLPDIITEVKDFIGAFGPPATADAARRIVRDAHQKVSQRGGQRTTTTAKPTKPMPRSQGSPAVRKPVNDPMEIAQQALDDLHARQGA